MARNYGNLRSHQAALVLLAADAILHDRKVTVSNCVPGGGKSRGASIFSHELRDAGDITHVLWLCPRDALRSQAEHGFTDASHGRNFRIFADGKKSLDQGDMHAKGAAIGYAQTIQSLTPKAVRRWAKRMRAGRWLLIIDEAHHLANEPDDDMGEDPAWTRACAELVDVAARVLLMSGTLRRHDGQAIAFVPYENRSPVSHVNYTLADALREHALVQIEFTLMDGNVAWRRRGVENDATLSEATRAELGDAVRAALEEPDFHDAWLCHAIEAWLEHRRETSYRSRMIVVCNTQRAARAVRNLIEASFPAVDPVLAISDEVESQKRIRAFRDRNEGDILVTVGMAYEGLDVVDCTHVVVLSNKKSEPWLEQVIGRVTRFNPSTHGNPAKNLPWGRQRAFVYLLNTKNNVAFVERMLDEQLIVLPSAQKNAATLPRGRSSFESLNGEKGAATIAEPGRIFTDEETAAIHELVMEHPGLGTDPREKTLALAYKLGRIAPPAAE